MTIAIWCIFIAAALPYVAFTFVKGLDPNQPRYHVADLVGQSVRAYGAHLNGLETFPWFAASVIVAHMLAGPSRIADALAVVLHSAAHWAYGSVYFRPPTPALGGVRRRPAGGAGDFRLAAFSLKTKVLLMFVRAGALPVRPSRRDGYFASDGCGVDAVRTGSVG